MPREFNREFAETVELPSMWRPLKKHLAVINILRDPDLFEEGQVDTRMGSFPFSVASDSGESYSVISGMPIRALFGRRVLIQVAAQIELLNEQELINGAESH